MNITPDLFKLTQRGRILKLLQRRGQSGVAIFEMITPRPEGLGVAQYNARILELREMGYNIINTMPGHFVLNDGSAEVEIVKPEKSDKLQGENLNSWQQMGAYLKGDGPKPEASQDFINTAQEALL